jgi:putative pyruvate formate lyase activating enzyme
MYSQVGNLKLDDRNIAQRGMIVRHLILPENMAGTREALTFLKNTFGKEINISLMAQYTPMFKAEEIPDINRRLTVKEYQEAIALLEELDLENGWYQHIEDLDEEFVFDFR